MSEGILADPPRDLLPARVRAFVAVSSAEAIQQELGRVQETLAAQVPRGSVAWSRPAQIHLTLNFLGDVASEVLPELKSALRDACAAAGGMQLSAGTLGAFPSMARPRVIWADVGGDVAALDNLQGAVGDATSRFGSHAERKPFSPHLTLGRVKRLAPADVERLAMALRSVRIAKGAEWIVDRVELLRSELDRGGARYTVLDTVMLGARR